MSDQREDASHGVHAAPREDGDGQEEPTPAEPKDDDLAAATDTGADAS